jgi:phage shock protein A
MDEEAKRKHREKVAEVMATKPDPRYDTLEYIDEQILNAHDKVAELRNLIEQLESKILAQNSFMRYWQHRRKTKMSELNTNDRIK